MALGVGCFIGSRSLAAGPVTAASVLASATWQLWADDALDSAGTLTSWPSDAGPSAILKAPPWTAPSVITVPARNNRKAVVFTRGLNTVLDVDGDVNPVAGNHSLLIFCDPSAPSHESASAHREYIISCDYNAQGRLIFSHNSNDGLITNTYRHPGFYNAANDGDVSGFWHVYQRLDNGQPLVQAIAGPQCRVDVLASGAGGVCKFWRDNVLLGTNPGHYLTTRAFARGSGSHRIGTETTAVPDSTNVTDFGGRIYCILYWPRALTDEEVQAISSYVMAYYAWTPRTYTLPNERANLQGWYSSAKNIAAGTAVPVASPVAWPDITARVSLLSGAIGVVDGAADFVPNQDLSRASALSSWVNANAYSVYCVFFADAVSTTSTITNANDVLCCDSAGRWGLHLRDAGLGTYELRGFHTDGTSKTVTIPAGELQLGQWNLAIWRFDGSTLYLQLNNGTVRTTSSVGNIVLLDGTLAFGGRPSDTTVQYDGKAREFAIFKEFHDNSVVAQTRTFFEQMRDAA